MLFAIGCGSTARPPDPAPPVEEGEKEVVEFPRELNDALVKAVISPALQKGLPEAMDRLMKELFTEFEIKDDVERQLWQQVRGEMGEEDDLMAFCVVKPASKPLPTRLYSKGDESRVLEYARVTIPCPRPLALSLARKKGGACRLCQSATYDEAAKKWVPQADVLKGEKETVRRAVAEALKGIDPRMPAIVGLQ
jgi:hypothetical protein